MQVMTMPPRIGGREARLHSEGEGVCVCVVSSGRALGGRCACHLPPSAHTHADREAGGGIPVAGSDDRLSTIKFILAR